MSTAVVGTAAAAERAAAKTVKAAGAVYARIQEVMAEVARIGINKTGVNQEQNYRFRSVDAVYEVMNPILTKVGLVMVPRMLSSSRTESVSKSGTLLFTSVVEAEFDFVAVSDGSKHTARTIGEGRDSGDKATNKAMSAAFKYALLMTFVVPLFGHDEGDSTSPEETGPQVPKGAVEFLTSLQKAAGEGKKALASAWKAGAEPLQAWVMANRRTELGEAKKTAAAVSAAPVEN